MSDWEVVQDNQPTQQSQLSSDWEAVPSIASSEQSQPSEGFGASLAKAPGRILGDIATAGFNAVKSIPNYYQSAKTEIPGIFSALKNHPAHAALQALAGSQEAINNLAQLPKSLSNYASNRLNLLPNTVSNFISKTSPEDTSSAIHSLFGEPQYSGENLIRGVSRNALNLYGAGKIANQLNPRNLTVRNIAKDVVNTGEENKKIYSNLYDNLWKEAQDKGYGDMSHIVPQIDIGTLRKYSPKKSIAGVEEFLSNPTIQTAHNAKSDLLRIQRDLGRMTTLKTAERKQFKAATDSIDDIRNNMFKDKQGKVDDDLSNKYNIIQQGFANDVIPYRNKAINKFKRNEISAKELVNSLSRGEFAAKKGSAHPAIGIRNIAKNHPYFAGAGLGVGLQQLYGNMMGHSPDYK